jgi:hypothetical protein
MGSAGFCTKEKSCAEKMIDCMDSCKNGFYKHEIRPDIFFLELRYKIQRVRDRIFKKKTETRAKKKEVDLTDFYF